MSAEACPPLRDRPRDAARKGKVLLAEDDPALRELLAATLEDHGYEVVAVPDGGRLLVLLARYFKEEHATGFPDVIVSDVRMPVMTGLAMANAVRDAYHRCPVVLMTAFPTEETRHLAAASGASLVAKPFAMEALLDAVRDALSGRLRSSDTVLVEPSP